MKNAICILGFLLFAGLAGAQELGVGDISAYKNRVTITVVNGDTTANISNNYCIILGKRNFTDPKEAARWDKLKRDVKKAYPYAVLAHMKLAEMDSQLALVKGERERKLFTERCEKELTNQFSSDMRNLTYTQGKILFKLLDRETGSTTYQIIQQRRGSFSAFMWQSVAFVFGNNLKAEYDPDGEDAKIEQVIELIELGLI